MEPLEIPGTTLDMALRFAPSDGKLLMMVLHRFTGGHDSVVLEPGYLLPLAAWFAGEAQPCVVGDDVVTPYSPMLNVVNDEAAVVWCTHTWARMRCLLPFGKAGVTIGPAGQPGGCTVTIPPGTRADIAAWLRRVDAEHWTWTAV